MNDDATKELERILKLQDRRRVVNAVAADMEKKMWEWNQTLMANDDGCMDTALAASMMVVLLRAQRKQDLER